ncbi:MAG: LuxR C-terminal-related transcriptional regulator [Egibacteraceae bacterium]
MAISCLLVEDHPATRDGLAAFLRTTDELRLVGAATSARQAVALDIGAPDVVVLDLVVDGAGALEEFHGAEAVEAVIERWPGAAVLVYTAFECRRCMVDAFAAGACGYLLKREELPVLARVIRQVADGEFPTPGLAGFLLSAEPEPGYHLTGREIEVLELLAEGMTNSEIARALRISQKTVANHLEAIRTKMRVGNRTEVVIKASRDGLIDGLGWNRSCACGAPRRRARRG